MNSVFFYVPNVIGYFRVILLFTAINYLDSNPVVALGAYFISSILDAVDGYAARILSQSSAFGSGLDMITDRCTTTSLILYLSRFIDFRLMAALVILDFSSHFLHMLVTRGKSHKECDEQTPFLMRLYYENRIVLFLVCGGYDWLTFCTAPVFAFKQVMNVVQLLKASQDLAALDDPNLKSFPDKKVKAKMNKSH